MQEGLAVVEQEGDLPAIFIDSHQPRYGEAYQIVALSLASGSATYQAVLSLLRTQFDFTPDHTPEPIS